MKKINLAGIITAFLVFAVIVGFVYHTGRQRKPLVYSMIPDVTMDWASALSGLSPINISMLPKGPFDWENLKDFGQEEKSWSNINTNPNTIIYYKNDPTHLNVQNARRSIEIADASVAEIEDVMGGFPYPSGRNGRKLPVYLASSQADFVATLDELGGTSATRHASSYSLLCFDVGPLGCMADGIVLNPKCFDYEQDPSCWAETVLKAEMFKYAYYSFLNYGKELSHPRWVIDGLVEYVCNPGPQVASADSIDFIANNCNLKNDFPLESNASAWAGKAFYKFLEETQGKIAMRSFIQNLFESDVDAALKSVFDETADVKSLWVDDMMSGLPVIDTVAVAPVLVD